MALRLTSMHVMDDEENENKRNGLSGVNRLKAMKEEQEDVPQPAANRNEPETEPTGVARLQALKNGQKQTTVTPAPETSSAVPASPAEPAAQQGRIRPGWDTADAAGASEAQDRREKPFTAAADNLRRLNDAAGVNIDDLREDLTQRAAERDAADSALGQIVEPWNRANATAQNLRSQVAAYETKLGMLQDTMDNSDDPEERRRAQQESQALDLYYQKAQRAAERYESRFNDLNTQFQQLAIARNKANRALETGMEQYDTLLSLGDKRAANYEQQARDLRDWYNAAYQSGMPNAWELQRQAENAEAKAAAERQNYAEYLAKTKGEGYASRYLQGIEDGNRAKAEKASFGEKVLNTVAGLGENFFSGVGGAPWIFMARLMEIPEDALYALTGNEAFNQDAPGRGPRTSQILQTNDPFRSDAETRKQRAGSLGGMLIDTGYAAGNMLGMTGLAGQVTGALSNTALMSKLSSIAESSTLATSPAARRGAQMAINALRSPGNLGVSLSSGVSSYSEALANGASFSQAMANGISKAVTEYVSNRLFSGMPLENAPGEKGYVTKAIEFLADKLGKSEALAAFNRTTGGKVLGWIYDKAGEGLEEVVTGLLDPIIDRMTYDKEADWLPKLDQLADEFLGGMMLSLLMSGGEAVLAPSMTRAQIAEDLVRQGVPKAEARKYAGMIYKDMKAAERAQKAVQEAAEAGITEAPEADAAPMEAATNESTPPVPGAVQENGPPVPGAAQENAAETAGTVQGTEAIPQTAPENLPGRETPEAAEQNAAGTAAAAMASEEQAETAAAQTPGEANAEAAGEKVTQRTLASERQKTAEKAASLRDAGFSTAGEDATARIRSEESWDAEEKAVGQALRDLGYEPTFTVGLIENAEGKSVPYLLEGNKLAVRSDHRNQSVQEIAERAVGQALDIDQGVRNQVMETITQARAAAKAARQAEKAAEKPAEKPEISARAQVAIESARAAGASEEAGALAGRLADIIGRDIRFFNEAEQNGAWKNGYTQNGVIYVNSQAKKTVAWVVGHELTHNVEHSKIYDSLKKLAQKDMGLNWGMRVQSRLDASARIAQKLGDDSVRLTDPADAEREIVADFFADRLLTDEASIRAVCEYEPVTARSIRDYIKNLLRKLGGKESTLERAVTLYNKALKDVAAKAQANAEGRLRTRGTEAQKQESGLRLGGERQFSAEDAATYNRTALITEDTVDKWLKDYAAKSSPKYAQAYITRMTPKQFIDLTTSTTGRLLIGNQTGALDAEKLIEATRDQPLQIRISDGEVIGHEGRHRATALARAGVESIPVLVFDSSNKYSKTDVPEMTLQGQDFGHSRSYATETLRDLIPLSYENRDRIVQEYGTQPATEQLQEKYSGRKTVQFSAEDEEYLAAVEAGDMETAQRMVDEAAKRAGYNRIGDYYVDNQIGLTEPEPTKRQIQAYELGQKYGDTDAGYRRLLMDDPDTYERIINNSALERWYLAGTRGTMPEYRLAIRYGDVPEGSRSRNWGTGELERGTSVVDFLTSQTQNGQTIYDAIYGMQNTRKNIVGGWDFGIFGSDGEPLLVDAQPVVAFSDVAKIKSAAPVTYDDAGKPIPLSERFNRVNEDIRYSAEDSDDEYRQAPGTEALDKLGIRLAGSKGQYHLAEQLLERDKAAKELMKATKKAEKKLKATKAEREFAAGIAAGVYDERDIPSSMNKDTVATLADYYAAEESFKTNMLAEVRGRINAEYQAEAEELLANVEHFKKLSMLMLNERTPDRSFRAMFGPTQGKAIFDWLIRPVQMNEAAKTRWHQEQLDKVRKFEDSKGKTRALTRAESELTMLVMEGKAAAAAVADMEKKGLDAKGIRNAAENIRNGEDAADAAWEFGLKDKERELARNYARWMDTQEKLKNADSTIIENAAEAYSKIFDEFYDGINDFLAAHGYEPIGYIKGYAPHMQPEETQSLLEKAFDKMGISLGNDKAQGLPASIAGETAYFKPNKRWDPYFLHRTGTQAEYDIEKAYQSYVGYLSDILFHTDDIMRVRNMERMIRKTYASDEIKENLDWIQEIRNSPTEERLGMLRDAGKIGKTTILSGSEVNDKLDEWEEEQFNALKEDRQYNNLAMWLSNYANILAGKQSFADRGWEYSLGRNSLNFANRMQAAFQRSLVAGSLTSALNQTAQLPMIKAELGDRWYYAALKDIITGQTRGFWKDSDFLTGKHGVDMLYTDNYDKFISALFKPYTVVDNIVSTTAVRGAFLKAIHQGQSYSEAMQTADDFGRRVMGSREKGTRPLAYESKGLFSRMIHMFQVEAANSWDHIASDLPYEIKEIARTQGKPKAARTLAALLVKALLSTFLLNRLTEEAYGGTPAPFDVIGLAMNFVASGQGMTTNRYLKTIIDNGLEKIGSDRLFGTEDVDAEFDVGKGLEELGYNVMNDVPLLRNLAGVLGLGDQTVPLPGAGGEFADAFTAAGDLIKEGADGQTIENLIRAAAKLGAQFVPAGRQLTKTAEGIETVIRGGSYSKKGKLQYPVDSTEDQVRAILFGKNATNAAQEHWASGENTLTDKQTELVSTMRGWGMSGAEARQVIRDIGGFEADTDPETGKTISGSKKAKVVDYIDGLKLTNDQKDQLYLDQGYAESGLDETPWHAKGGSSGRGKTYSMGGLRLPTPERREPISSGLRLQSAPAARPSSGGLRLK